MAQKIFFCEVCGHAADWETGELDPPLTNLVLEKGKGEATCKQCLREGGQIHEGRYVSRRNEAGEGSLQDGNGWAFV